MPVSNPKFSASTAANQGNTIVPRVVLRKSIAETEPEYFGNNEQATATINGITAPVRTPATVYDVAISCGLPVRRKSRITAPPESDPQIIIFFTPTFSEKKEESSLPSIIPIQNSDNDRFEKKMEAASLSSIYIGNHTVVID